ncbi:MAG: pilus assembly protein PilM [Candidatus Omnitrophica bacterium]|nr:pilus assembly protein PilM [Candidatus Omnitrophota bacterium]
MADGVGIYLGAQSIDLVHLSGTFRIPRVLAAHHLDLDRPLTDTPETIAALAPALQRLVRQSHLTSPEAHLGLSADTAIIRYFQMPTVPPQDRAGAARFEAKKYHPFKLQDLNADAHTVILKSDPSVMRVMFYAAKKELVAEHLRALQQADIQPRSMETSLTSLMRAVRRTQQLPPRQSAILITVDRDMATLAIIQHDLVYLARNVTVLPRAGEGVSPAAGDGKPAATIYDALVNDTVVSADYYRRRFPNEPPITKVFVNGLGVPAAWPRELSAAVELPVEPLDAGRDVIDGQALNGNAAIAFGLALRALEPGRSAVNLMPQDLQPPPQGVWRLMAVEAIAAVAVLMVLHQLSLQPVRRLATQLSALQHPDIVRVLQLNAADMTPERLQQRRAELAAELTLVRGATAPGAPAAVLLSHLATATPDTVWLRRLGYRHVPTPKTARELSLEGSAYHANAPSTLETINTYAAALNRDAAFRASFGDLAVTSVQRTTQSSHVTDFRLVSTASSGGSS